MCKVGVLALQGDFFAHGRLFDRLGVAWRKIATAASMEGIEGLVIPGGESTTLLKLLDRALEARIRELARRGGVLFGTCAGAILLARKVLNPGQASLGLMDMEVLRNGYGRQNESFVVRPGDEGVEGIAVPSEMVFIRAPIIEKVGAGVRVLTRLRGLPVYVREGNIMATTFHPELTGDLSVHAGFLKLLDSRRAKDRGWQGDLSAASP